MPGAAAAAGSVEVRMYRFARQPRWVVGHVLVVLLAVVMVGLGLWQLRRLDERKDHNALLASRSSAPAVALDELLAEVGPEEAEFRWATATGTFDPGAEVLVRGRALGGLPGFDVLTPLRTAGGGAVVVDRGWVPMDVGERWPVAEAAPPTGEVEVTGLVRASQRRRGLAVADAADGTLTTIARADLDRLGQQLPYAIRPVLLQATTTAASPTFEPLPAAHLLPDLGEGSHLSYAIQWFAFSLIVVVGWLALLRRTAHPRAGGPARPGPPDPPDPSGALTDSPPGSQVDGRRRRVVSSG
jgi:surfeit locus 1 family protein